jgi:glycosyltransferase involved in cell wall biosynthesis
MARLNLMLVDSTFLGKNPQIGRERSVPQIRYWVKEHKPALTVLTTKYGCSLYKMRMEEHINSQVDYQAIPLAADYEKIPLLLIPLEYIKRIIGGFFVRIPQGLEVVYTITPIISDVVIALIIKLRKGSLKIIVNYDNFVPKPWERPGKSFVHLLIPYLSFKITLFLLRYVDGFISYMSPQKAGELSRIFKGKKKVLNLTNGLDLDLINSVAESEKKKFDILYLGRLHPAKGIWDLLKLVVELKKENDSVKACLIGPADKTIEKGIDEFIVKNSLQGNVEKFGFAETRKKYELLKSGKVFVFFSYDDSSPITVMEAIACRLPVIVYDLEIFSFPPFKDAYLTTIKKGEYLKAAGIVKDLLDNYESKKREIAELYNKRELVIPIWKNSEKEFQFFCDFAFNAS